jgi:sugar lactone lactonase YvrE
VNGARDKFRGVHDVKESLRLPSPAPLPQSLAFDGDKLWMGSIETCRLYALDPRQWTVIEEDKVPGKPWGVTVVGDELRVICGEGEEDDRVIRRFVPGHGFKTHDAVACPDDTGSQLSYDGTWLYLSQWYKQRLLGLDEQGKVMRQIDLPRGVCGQCYVDGYFYVITTDDETTNEYFLGKIGGDGAAFEDFARIPFAARALAYDGSRFWTNHREANEIVAFER